MTFITQNKVSKDQIMRMMTEINQLKEMQYKKEQVSASKYHFIRGIFFFRIHIGPNPFFMISYHLGGQQSTWNNTHNIETLDIFV